MPESFSPCSCLPQISGVLVCQCSREGLSPYTWPFSSGRQLFLVIQCWAWSWGKAVLCYTFLACLRQSRPRICGWAWAGVSWPCQSGIKPLLVIGIRSWAQEGFMFLPYGLRFFFSHSSVCYNYFWIYLGTQGIPIHHWGQIDFSSTFPAESVDLCLVSVDQRICCFLLKWLKAFAL